MAAGHGGKRAGAGRKPGSAKAPNTTMTTQFDSVLSYLRAVALGSEPGDALRVAAAKAALPFEAPKARAPVQSPPPATLRAKVERSADKAELDDFAARAAAVRRKHSTKGSTP